MDIPLQAVKTRVKLLCIFYARELFKCGYLDDAVRFSQRVIEMAQAGDNAYLQIEFRLPRASIFKAKQDIAAALGELNSALSLTETGGFIMIFVSKGKSVADMLAEMVAVKKGDHDVRKAGFSLAYAKKILSVFKAGIPPKIESLIDPISERELEVLHLIARIAYPNT